MTPQRIIILSQFPNFCFIIIYRYYEKNIIVQNFIWNVWPIRSKIKPSLVYLKCLSNRRRMMRWRYENCLFQNPHSVAEIQATATGNCIMIFLSSEREKVYPRSDHRQLKSFSRYPPVRVIRKFNYSVKFIKLMSFSSSIHDFVESWSSYSVFRSVISVTLNSLIIIATSIFANFSYSFFFNNSSTLLI